MMFPGPPSLSFWSSVVCSGATDVGPVSFSRDIVTSLRLLVTWEPGR